MKISKSKLKQIIKEELENFLRETDLDNSGDLSPGELRSMADELEKGSGQAGGGVNLHMILQEIAEWMETHGVHSPEKGIDGYLANDPDAQRHGYEKYRSTLINMSDEIYEYMD